MEDSFKKDWEEYINTGPSASQVRNIAFNKDGFGKPAWDYLKESGKADRKDAVCFLVKFPEVKDDVMRYLGHLKKDEAIYVIQNNGPCVEKAYDVIRHDMDSLVELLHSSDSKVVDRAWNYAHKKISTDQLVDLMTYKSGIHNHDQVQEYAWNNVNLKKVSDSDLELIVLQAPEKYKENAAEVLHARTDDPKVKEEMRQILINRGNTYLMTDEEKQSYFERRFGL